MLHCQELSCIFSQNQMKKERIFNLVWYVSMCVRVYVFVCISCIIIKSEKYNKLKKKQGNHCTLASGSYDNFPYSYHHLLPSSDSCIPKQYTDSLPPFVAYFYIFLCHIYLRHIGKDMLLKFYTT